VGGVTISPPQSRLERAGFLLAGLGDWVFSGGALFLLLPHPALTQAPAFLAVFVAGSVVGSASGVPGGLGVFEAVMLGLSAATSRVHETAAALITYRLINAVAPLMIACAALVARRVLTRRP
jgi:phosphatidylglycerol lysyltransferase